MDLPTEIESTTIDRISLVGPEPFSFNYFLSDNSDHECFVVIFTDKYMPIETSQINQLRERGFSVAVIDSSRFSHPSFNEWQVLQGIKNTAVITLQAMDTNPISDAKVWVQINHAQQWVKCNFLADGKISQTSYEHSPGEQLWCFVGALINLGLRETYDIAAKFDEHMVTEFIEGNATKTLKTISTGPTFVLHVPTIIGADSNSLTNIPTGQTTEYDVVAQSTQDAFDKTVPEQKKAVYLFSKNFFHNQVTNKKIKITPTPIKSAVSQDQITRYLIFRLEVLEDDARVDFLFPNTLLPKGTVVEIPLAVVVGFSKNGLVMSEKIHWNQFEALKQAKMINQTGLPETRANSFLTFPVPEKTILPLDLMHFYRETLSGCELEVSSQGIELNNDKKIKSVAYELLVTIPKNTMCEFFINHQCQNDIKLPFVITAFYDEHEQLKQIFCLWDECCLYEQAGILNQKQAQAKCPIAKGQDVANKFMSPMDPSSLAMNQLIAGRWLYVIEKFAPQFNH